MDPRHITRFGIAGILFAFVAVALAQCTARADGPSRPRLAFELPRTQAEVDESERARLSTLRPPPRLFTCSPDIEAHDRAAMAEFWQIVRTSESLGLMIDRVRARFSPGDGIYLPIYFDACVDYGEGQGRVRHRTVIRSIGMAAADAAIGLPRVLIKVEVVAPAREHQERVIAVELKAPRF